ncbi:sulfatase-like hydrolase/transferase [Aestuariimicrobium ganziense]|uniref:sulfatase-like hydrolase/transferase n=1 Tax=Aestuariimicrobium ganziense TaxID=2773677 RepID=UPI0019441872|nr:sulfatase-like hydrolase/transferase [Aestuariimicrobium ganziense]
MTPSTVAHPNIVVLLTDDQGPWSVPWLMPELQMPELQRLRDEGLELSQVHCASPVCSPARASLMTGMVPSAHGIHDWISPDGQQHQFLAGIPTTGEVLAGAGYQCMMSGKWHVGWAQHPAPGFEDWYAHRFGGSEYVNAPIWRDGEPADEPRYFTRAVADEAVDFLKARDRERPFYLYVATTAPHTPWLRGHPDDLTSRYADCDFESVPREPRHEWARRSDFDESFADPIPSLVGYAAALTGVDECLGALRAELKAQGVWDDTIVVFLGDNGFSCGHHGIWGKGNGTVPLNLWDNSVRVPCVVRMPGGATGRSQALLSSASLHATLCELAGVDLPATDQVEGSFADVVRGQAADGDEVVVVASEYGGARMITDGRHALTLRHDGPDEFYDRADDPDERHNLIDDPGRAGVRDDLTAALRDWYAARADPERDAWARPVAGYGQNHPVWDERAAHEGYVQGR